MSLADFYINNEYWFASIQLILAMFGVGATLTASDFRDVARESKPVSIGTLVQLVLIPLSALLFISTLGLMGGIAVSIALLAAIPGGASSNFFTYFAHGNFASGSRNRGRRCHGAACRGGHRIAGPPRH